MELKYILDDYGNFALFSKVNTHSDMAKGFYKKPVSAGFCRIEAEETHHGERAVVVCWGESISLNLKSRAEDGDIINKKLNSYD